MFKGQKYQPNTSFEFVNYQQSSAGEFREPKKQKVSIPNTLKFQLPTPPPSTRTITTSQLGNADGKIPVEQTHTFIADHTSPNPKTIRKPSYTITTEEQKVRLLTLIDKQQVYKCKPKIAAWKDVVTNYNNYYNLNDKDGLTIQHARVKLNQIISGAQGKPTDKLAKDEVMALKYDKERLEYKNNKIRDVKVDKKYENKHPKPTKVYELILNLKSQIESKRSAYPQFHSSEELKRDLWLLHKRILDLKTIEEQYQIVEEVNYVNDRSSHPQLSKVKVSKEMRDILVTKTNVIQEELEKLLKVAKGGIEDVVDTELLDKK